MNLDNRSKTHISLASLFTVRSSKDEQLEQGWVNMPSSCSWTLDDKEQPWADVDDGPKLSSTHSRTYLSKMGRSKSMEEALRPMASLRASFAGMRSCSFRSAKAVYTSRHEANLLPPANDGMSLDDSSSGVSFHEDAVVVTDVFSDVPATQIVFTPRQEGTLIRRRRAKQLSKGRQNMRKIVVRSVSTDSEKIWDKFLQCAVAPGPEE